MPDSPSGSAKVLEWRAMYLVTSSDVQPTGSACAHQASSYVSCTSEETHRDIVVMSVDFDTRTPATADCPALRD